MLTAIAEFIVIDRGLKKVLQEDRTKLPLNFWQEKCKEMLEQQRRVTSNSLLHDDEDAKRDRKQIYVPLALVERRKPDKKKANILQKQEASYTNHNMKRSSDLNTKLFYSKF
jgi:hypothetical protein